jgi:dTDP-4-amino-4,6-dideoxygalactose transaminase
MINIISPIRPDFSKVEAYMKEGLTHGVLSNFGPTYQKLVSRLRDYLQLSEDRDIVLVSSGHTALMAAYNVLGTGRVVMSSYTFPSTRQAAEIQGIFTSFCDVDLATGCPTPKTLDSYKYADTIAITTAVSNIPNLKELSEYAKVNHKKLVIDGAPSFGTPGIYNYGDMFCLSFHATKTFGIGEGGAVICSKGHAATIKKFISFGFDDKKNVCFTGMNGKISEYTCGVGLSILDEMDLAIARRKRNAAIYQDRLGDLCWKSWIPDTVYQTFPIFARSARHAENIRAILTNKSVQHLQYYRPLGPGSPNTNSLYERNICLPIHSHLIIDQVHFICDLVLSV